MSFLDFFLGRANAVLQRHDQAAAAAKPAPIMDEEEARRAYIKEKTGRLFRKFQEEGLFTKLYHAEGIVRYLDGQSSSFKDDWATKVFYSEKSKKDIEPFHYVIQEIKKDASGNDISEEAIVDIFVREGFVFLSFNGKSKDGSVTRREINYDII